MIRPDNVQEKQSYWSTALKTLAVRRIVQRRKDALAKGSRACVDKDLLEPGANKKISLRLSCPCSPYPQSSLLFPSATLPLRLLSPPTSLPQQLLTPPFPSGSPRHRPPSPLIPRPPSFVPSPSLINPRSSITLSSLVSP